MKAKLNPKEVAITDDCEKEVTFRSNGPVKKGDVIGQ